MSLGQQFLDLCSSLQDDSGGLDEFASSAPAPKAPPPQKQYVRDDPPMNQSRGPPPPRRQQPFVSRTSVRQPSHSGRFRPQGRPGGMVRPVGPGSSGIRPVRPRGQIVTSVRVNAPRRIGAPGDKPNVKQVRVAPGSGPGSLRNRPMRHGAPQQSPVHQRRQPPPQPQQHRMDDGVIDLDQDHPRDDYYQDNRSYGNNQRQGVTNERHQRDDMGGIRRSSDQFDRGGIKRPSSISPKPDNRNMGYSQNNSNYQSGYNEGYQNKQPVRKPVNQGPGPPPGRIRPGAPNRGPPNSNQQNRNQNYRQGPPQSQMSQRRPPPPSQSLEQPDRGNQNQRSPNLANQRHPSGNRVPQIQKPQQQPQNDQDFGQFGDYNNRGNNRAPPAPTPPNTQNNQKFRQEPQLSPPKPNDSTDISAIMDDILSPPQKSVHQTQQPPTQKQPPMSRNPSAGQQPANKRSMGRDGHDMNNLVPPMNNNQNQQSLFEQKDRMNRMTPSPAAPSPGQQPTPPPPGQQKQKPSMPSWFSGSGSFGKSSSANQPMTPSPSQPSPGTPSMDALQQNAPQSLSGIKNEPAPFSPDVSKQKPITTSVLSSSLSSTFPASSAPVPTNQPQQNSVFSSSLFNQDWVLICVIFSIVFSCHLLSISFLRHFETLLTLIKATIASIPTICITWNVVNYYPSQCCLPDAACPGASTTKA